MGWQPLRAPEDARAAGGVDAFSVTLQMLLGGENFDKLLLNVTVCRSGGR